MTEKEIEDIAFKFVQGKATPEEEARLHEWYGESESSSEELLVVQTDSENQQQIKNRLFTAIQVQLVGETEPFSGRRFSKRPWLGYVAASLFLFLSIAGFYFHSTNHLDEPIRYTKLLKGDVGPGGNNAILELGTRVIINLDQAAIGELDTVGGILITKEADGMLVIEASGSSVNRTIEMNTIKTPAGGQYQLKLPDGTRVWLNASSIIRFPNGFAEDFREVELEGEAYFEVAKVQHQNRSRIPFFIVSKDQRIEVLGTRFNVYNYPGESTKTTLLEGSVKVYSVEKNIAEVLIPGQQSDVSKDGIDVKTVDMESSLAWRNGDFIFDNENLRTIMKKIGRWYDVDVEYKGSAVAGNFSGAVSRSKNLSEVLRIMEFTGKVKFKIDGRRVTVMM